MSGLMERMHAPSFRRASDPPVNLYVQDEFVAAVKALPEVREILSRGSGQRVHFLVLADDDWADVTDRIEPAIRQLRLQRPAAFDYEVRRERPALGYEAYRSLFVR